MTEAAVRVGKGNADWRVLDGVAKQRIQLPRVPRCLQRIRESGKLSGLACGACDLHRSARSLGPGDLRYDTVLMGDRSGVRISLAGQRSRNRLTRRWDSNTGG